MPDADVARQGRSALPFTQGQIETLGRLLRQTQRASARGAGAPPQGRIRRIRLDGLGDGQIPVIALRRGYTTVLSFTGMTGAPWPIAETVLDSRFLPPGQEAAPEAANPGAGHLLYLAPRQAYLDGNAVVTLVGLAEPLVVALRGTGGAADFRVDIRLAMPGPNADPALLAQPEGFHAGDPVLLGLLGGAVPPDAERLAVEGGGYEGRAWRQGGDLLLVTRAYLLSPGPWAAERGPGGRWAYRLPDTPQALVSVRGREILAFVPLKGNHHATCRTSMMNNRSIGETPRNRRIAIHRLHAPWVSSLLICASLAASSGSPGSAWAQMPDNRGVKLNPEDSVPPAYLDTLDERDRVRLDAARQQGESFVPIFPGRGQAPDYTQPAGGVGSTRSVTESPPALQHQPGGRVTPRPTYEAYSPPRQEGSPPGRLEDRISDLIGVLLQTWSKPPQIVRIRYPAAKPETAAPATSGTPPEPPIPCRPRAAGSMRARFMRSTRTIRDRC